MDRRPSLAIRVLVRKETVDEKLSLTNRRLTELLRARGYGVERAFTIEAPQAPYEESELEYQAKVFPPADRFGPTIYDIASQLANDWCDQALFGYRLHFKLNSAFFPMCVSFHSLTAFGFAFGHMTSPGHFLAHYSHCLSERDELCGYDIRFRHDQQEMSLAFDADYKRYNINVEYKLVHSLVVDLSVDGDDNLKLILDLKAPPKIEELVENEDTDSPRRICRKRCQCFSDCPQRVIGGSSALCIFFSTTKTVRARNDPLRTVVQLTRNKTSADIQEIVGRMRWRAKSRLPIAYCAVKVHGMQWSDEDDQYRLDATREQVQQRLSSFQVQYFVWALMSRGFRVTDQLAADCNFRFVELVGRKESQDAEITEVALEQVLAAIDEQKNIDISHAFQVLWNQVETEAVAEEERVRRVSKKRGKEVQMPSRRLRRDLPDNCVLVRKCVVTPTRIYFSPSEILMGNRVLRTFDEDCALRVHFRDDNGQQMGTGLGMWNKDLLADVVRHVMSEGIEVAGRHYRFLAWSNSQMRDQSVYFWASTINVITGELAWIDEIRDWMGDFSKNLNVPKQMSRRAQCFTQAQVAFPLDDAVWKQVDDVETNFPDYDQDNRPYVFSDGVGTLSSQVANEIATALHIRPPTPCAFQIRFAGCKGMLAVDPRLSGFQIIFRKSMVKFENSSTACKDLEIVKWSAPCPVYLNRPLINILDQVSQKQSVDKEDASAHVKVKKKIHQYLQKELFTLAEMLCSEQASVTAVKDRISAVRFSGTKLHIAGFRLTKEPFFRRLLLAIHGYHIKEQLVRMKVEMPWKWGRTLYGIMDEFKILGANQVFLQISSNRSNPGRNKRIIKGKVMVTKNPCISPGDVRLLEAVDVPEFRDVYCDVIIFPQVGKRCLPSMMGGADLDGDEFAAFWDEDIMFLENEDPLEFPNIRVWDKNQVEESDMIDFFIKYISNESMGRIATLHLCHSDYNREGLYADVCEDLALKYSEAVDFPKSGAPIEPIQPDEELYVYPDFKPHPRKVAYRSKRLLGEMYRKVKKVDEMVELGVQSTEVTVDNDLQVDGWTAWKKDAQQNRDRYFAEMQALLDSYGIVDEASVVSGHITTIRNRLSAHEKEDFSFMNTDKVVELRFAAIFRKYRTEFLQEFGDEVVFECVRSTDGILAHQPVDRFDDEVELPTLEMMQKASAWYMVTYDCRLPGFNKDHLSFPWVVWDVLRHVKRMRMYGHVHRALDDPVRDSLSAAILNCASDPNYIEQTQWIANLQPKFEVIAAYAARYEDLNYLFFVLNRWASNIESEEGKRVFVKHSQHLPLPFSDGSQLSLEYVCLLLIMFGRKLLDASADTSFLGDITDDVTEEENVSASQSDDEDEGYEGSVSMEPCRIAHDLYLAEELNSVDQALQRNNEPEGTLRLHNDLGVFMLNFLRFLGSESFRNVDEINLSLLDQRLPCVHSDGWVDALHSGAFHAYQHMALTAEFDSVWLLADGEALQRSHDWDVAEMEPKLIAMPPELDQMCRGDRRTFRRDISNIIRRLSNVKSVDVCVQANRDNPRLMVSAIGRLRNRELLENLLLSDKFGDILVNEYSCVIGR